MSRFVRRELSVSVDIASKAKLLLVTATSVETSALHKAMRPIAPHKKCISIAIGTQTYFIGKIGKIGVIHVQCQMGSLSPGASMLAVTEAFTHWNIAAVVMVGIAFGIDKNSQRIGDVLISKSINSYEIQRVGKKGTIQRGMSPPSGAVLLDRFSNSQGWEFKLSKRRLATAKPVDLLSGEKLIDNQQFKARLLKAYPNARGGEMEGAGLFAAAHQKGIEWIVVKAICDFADGNKSRRKKQNQTLAAASAVSYCKHVFSKKGNLSDLGCIDLETPKSKKSIGLNIDEILFEIYELRFEPAYLQREIDSRIGEYFTRQGIWLSGVSGCGKTNSLRRAAFQSNRKTIFIDLAKCVGSSATEIFQVLYLEIVELFNAPVANPSTLTTAQNHAWWIDAITDLVAKHTPPESVIFIDEIPLGTGEEFDRFVSGIAAITISLTNRSAQCSKFVLSSIENPLPTIRDFQKKVTQQIRFIHLSKWTNNDLRQVLKRICVLAKLKLAREQSEAILKAVDGCPRKLKAVLKLVASPSAAQKWPIEKIIQECCSIE